MLSYEQALEKVINYIRNIKPVLGEGDELVLVEEETLDCEFGWVFFYDSKKHIETLDFKYAIAGNAPLLVNKRTEQLLELGTVYSAEKYIQHYQKTGKVLK